MSIRIRPVYFCDVQHQDIESRFDTAAKKMFFTRKDLVDTFRQKRSRATSDAAYAAAHDSLVAQQVENERIRGSDSTLRRDDQATFTGWG